MPLRPGPQLAELQQRLAELANELARLARDYDDARHARFATEAAALVTELGEIRKTWPDQLSS